MSRGYDNDGFEKERFSSPDRDEDNPRRRRDEREPSALDGRRRRYRGADGREAVRPRDPRSSSADDLEGSYPSRHYPGIGAYKRNLGNRTDSLQGYKAYFRRGIDASPRSGGNWEDTDNTKRKLPRIKTSGNLEREHQQSFYDPEYEEMPGVYARHKDEQNWGEMQHNSRYKREFDTTDAGNAHGSRINFTHSNQSRGPETDDQSSQDDLSLQESNPDWEGRRQTRGAVMEMLPSQMDRVTGTLRFRGQVFSNAAFQDENGSIMDTTDVPLHDQVKSKAEVLDHLTKLREQPWPMALRKERQHELKLQLDLMGDRWYSVTPVKSAVKSGTNRIKDIMHTLDPMYSLMKRIEGKHGASVVAVFNFIRDMIRLNLFIAILVLGGIVVPSALSVSQDTDQMSGWTLGNHTSDLCSDLSLLPNSTLQDCNKNYTEKINKVVKQHSYQLKALLQDFLQGTGFLEWTLLFSGYYPPAVTTGTYNISLAYLLTVFVTYVVSLIFVVRFVAKFLRGASVSGNSYQTNYSEMVFAGWDYTIKEPGPAKTELALFSSEVKAALDDDNYNARSRARTRSDEIKLYSARILINLLIVALIGGSWAGIYFLVHFIPEPSEVSPSDGITVLESFFWEYAPTLLVAGLNLIFPVIFSVLVRYEQYTGRKELFLTLGRCVLVRLTSLGILIITKIGLIYQRKKDDCDVNDEFVCWETHLGQQVYAILILDLIIQVAMTFIVNVLRMMLTFLKSPVLQKIGTIEFFVPGHVLDVVYIQAVCWVGLLYSPLLVPCCFVYFCFTFLCKLFTISVTCVPSSRVFRASRSSAMFMTILALAFFMCIIPNALSMLYLQPSMACSPFRGLDYAWQVFIYYICAMTGSAYWIRSTLFYLDDTLLCVPLFLLLIIIAVYHFAIINARGAFIEELEKKLKNTNKDKKYLLEQFQKAQEI
ncbi:transmembrane channel-like protein 7 [Palaemon carinicauda]|uniref:transmembrane channel-like protein 7 n=1 Tax=Palaemon carinicauda TaxID=392227 RepID=UPI0035B63848